MRSAHCGGLFVFLAVSVSCTTSEGIASCAVEFEDDRPAGAIAAEWDVDIELLLECEWDVEAITGNDDALYGYLVRFDDETNPEVLERLGVPPGQFYRELSINAFDRPDPDDFGHIEPQERLNSDERGSPIDDDHFNVFQFRRLSREGKIDAMVQWFHENYEDPAIRTPYESAEGGYQWIWGGPYDAYDEIGDRFSDVAEEDLIEAAASEVTQDGLFDWAPKERPEDYEHNDEPDDGIHPVDEPLPDLLGENGAEEDDNELPDLPLGQAYLATENGSILTDEQGRRIIVDVSRSGDTLKREVLSRLDDLEAALKAYQENIPPETITIRQN